MGKLTYTFSPASNYKNGYDAGYKKGKEDTFEVTLQTILETITLLLYDAEWEQDQIQEFADRLTRGVIKNCDDREGWKKLVEEARAEGLEVTYDGKRHLP